MLRRFIVFLYFLCCLHGISGAQTGPFEISGHVISSENDIMPNTTILFNGKDIYSSDIHGDFMIGGLSPGRYTLQFTYIGYDSLNTSVEVTNQDIHLDITLKSNEIQLNEVIVVGDHFRTGRIEQSQTIQSVDADFLKMQNSGTLINSIQKLPGINAINTGVGIAKPVIRGMSFNRVLVMDKGIKQEGQQWGADHGLEIDQYDPEKLEVVKGPSSLLYGSDAIGGAIRILPPVIPADDHLRGGVFLTYKSNNQLVGTSTNLQGSKKGKFFRFRFSTQDFGDYMVPASSFTYNGFVLPILDDRLKNTAGNERNVSFSGGLKGKWGTSSITVSNFHQRAGLFSGATGIPREYQLEDDGDFRNIDLPRQVVNHLKIISNTSLILGKNWLELDFGYQLNDRKEEGAPHAHGYQPTPEGDLALGLDLKTFSGNLRYNNNLAENLSGMIGLQGQWQENRHAGFEFLLPDFQAGNIGGYIYQEYSPSHKFAFNAGVRYDYGMRDIDEHVEPDYTTPESEDSIMRNPDIYRQFNNFSAAFGMSYYPDIYFNTKLNIGTSFRMPTAPELSSNGVHHGTFRHERGDPNLDSERGIQADWNLTYLRNAIYALFTPYVAFYNKYIYLAPLAEFSELPAGGQVYQYTQNDAIFTGFEFSFEYEFFQNWHFRTASEYVWNENLDTSLPLPFTPPFSIYGELEYGKKKFNSRVSYYFISINYHYFADQNRVDRNERSTPGYDLVKVNAGFDYKIENQIAQIRLSVHNLFNKAYMNHLSRYRLLNLPEQGRNVVLSVRIPFSVK